MKRFLAIGALAMALSTGAAHAASLYVRFGPPAPPREVVVVRPGPRHVWVPGYYRWQGGRYAWVGGVWVVPPRHRAVWVPGYWAPRHHHRDGGYIWVRGYWR